MNKKNKMVGALAVLTVALLVSMALPATANHDDKTGKTHKDPDGKITYINLGVIGDHIISCPGGISVTLFPNGASELHVRVEDPTDASNPPLVDQTVPLPGGPYGPIPIVDIPDQRICLGGAFSSTSGSTPPAIPSYWEVWIEDVVRDLIDLATGGNVDGVKSGFARMVASASRSDTTRTSLLLPPETCIPGSGTSVCPTTTVTETQTKVLAQFSVCGKAAVSGIDTDTFTDLIADKGAYDNYELTKTVFTDGILFFQLDCGLGGSGLGSEYNDFVNWFNNDPANPPTGVPLWSQVPQVNPTCNPGIEGFTVCLFPLPTGDSFCWNTKYAAGHTVAGPGIIGTIGWSHDDIGNLNCHESLGASPWLKTISTSVVDFEIEHFPVHVETHP